MPVLLPDAPEFGEGLHGERAVWEALRADLSDDQLVMHSIWLIEGHEEREADLVVVWPGLGVAVIEVKGGRVVRHDGSWCSEQGSQHRSIPSPAVQAQDARHALTRYLAGKGLKGLRSVHMVALPHMRYARSPVENELPRDLLIDRDDLAGVASRVRNALEVCGRGSRVPSQADVSQCIDLFAGQMPKQPTLFVLTEEHEQRVEQMTRDQVRVLDRLKYHRRLVVVGGAGTGKTWVAIEQARRLAAKGERVALLCYSRGLARFLQRVVATWPADRRPAYVGMFHDLPIFWGAKPGDEGDPLYWDQSLPAALAKLASLRPPGDLFDAIVVDEAQDFMELWWQSLLRCLRTPTEGRMYLFLDESQRIFARQGILPVEDPPYVLDENIRNTKRVAETFGSLSSEPMKLRGMGGPPVRFVPCPTERATATADLAVDALREEGFVAGQIALLTTGPRHRMQVRTVEQIGWAQYWDSFFSEADVFYGHVLGFKGLERPAVVLSMNGFKQPDLGKAMLYVGLSRARSLLVVVGDLDAIAHVGGEGLRKRLTKADRWTPSPGI